MSVFSDQIDVTEKINERISLREHIKNRKFLAAGLGVTAAFLGIGAVAVAAVPGVVAGGAAVVGAVLSKVHHDRAKNEEQDFRINHSLASIKNLIKEKGWSDERDFVEKRKQWLTVEQQQELEVELESKVNIADKIATIRDKFLSPEPEPQKNVRLSC